ncbi:DUF7507 domain-containing protein [Streptomyces sp. E-08]|uniref:DUF7507 domain-containing protein n=1 Tax=Streptomyces sp. E-08 TaxID=3404047 RepID=UPI003CF6C1D5
MSGALLVVVLLLLPGAVAWAGGAGDGALRMTVTVNGRPDGAARPTAVRAGAPVEKRYRLVNHGEAHLYAVRILDPGVPGGALRCPGEPLAALGEMECVARFTALPGVHLDTARAEGDIPSLGRTVAATARSGYSGVSGSLGLTERVSLGGRGAGRAGRSVGAAPDGTATVTYTVTNRGNQPVRAVRVEDPALRLGPGAVDCGAGTGTLALLAPGASARCTATVLRPPGTHRSTGLATGSDRVPTYDAAGVLVPAPALTARSSAAFTIASPTASGVGGGSGVPGAGGAGGVGGSSGGGSGPGGGGAAPGAAAGASGAGGVAGASGSAGGSGSAGPSGSAGGSASARASGASGASEVSATSGTSGSDGALGAAGVAASVPGGSAVPRTSSPAPPRTTDPAAVSVPRPHTVPDGAADGRQRVAAAARGDEGFLGRVQRRAREAREFGVVAMLLLLLIPAAVAAALLGNRGN